MNGGLLSATAAALLVTLGACSPVRTHQGFVADTPEATTVQIGVDTRDTVRARLGTPSTTGVMDAAAWYYVASDQQRIAFLRPRTVSREVIVVRFGEGDVVQSVDRFGIERGNIVAYNDNATPTRGRELGILEQIFGNVGRGSPIRTEDNEGGRRRN
ncbi:MAG: outer membrane protein assembly factor BamE [Alphaproteobacteria bacterium]|nr:outer membrane protein assembly factor BamE [Alphaproteobacteria bacterium]